MRKQRSRGFTLIEIIVSMAIVAVIGAAFTKLLVAQNRYYDHETNLRKARSIARSASTILLADMRMVQTSGGVDSVAADGKLIRLLVPYRFGLVCAQFGSNLTVSMLPIDSGTIGVSVYRGYAWRDSLAGTYTYVSPTDPTSADLPKPSANVGLCTGNGPGQAQINTLAVAGAPGTQFDISPAPAGVFTAAPVFFWQRVTYSFRASSLYPNRLGLWRNVENGRNEEIMAPFDTSSRFRFYASGSDVSTVAPPLAAAIRGLDLVLAARSPRPTTRDSAATSTVVTSVFFKNRVGF